MTRHASAWLLKALLHPQAIERKIEKYRAIGDDACAIFEPVEKLLREMGHEFEHPSLRLHEQMVEGVQRVMVKYAFVPIYQCT